MFQTVHTLFWIFFEHFTNVQATIKINYFCFLPRKMSHKPLGKFESKQVIINSVAGLQKNLKKIRQLGFSTSRSERGV